MGKKKLNKLLLTFTLVDLILVFILMVNITKLGVVPFKYVLLIVLILFLLFTITILIQKLRKHKTLYKTISYTIFSILLIVSCVGIYYSGVTLKFLRESFNIANSSYISKYVIISKGNYENEYDLIGKKIGYYSNVPHIDKAISKLKNVIDFEEVSYKSIVDLYNKYDKELDAIVMQDDFYKGIKETLTGISYSDYKTIYEFEVTIDENINTDELKDSVNIYLGGFDFTENNNDLNMIITMNRNTRKILLTSIPRDYYLYVPSLGMEELLDYTMVWGVDQPIGALEQLFDIKIDYYIKVNTSSLVGLVDALGGLEYCSDISFTSTHALVTDTYDDTQGKKLRVEKGCREYNGVEILTIARERLAFDGGDRQRQKNCQQILINIANKIASAGSITKYTELLDKLSELYTTNMPSKLLTNALKDTIDGNKWDVETQSVDGKGGTGLIHVGTARSWSVMIPDTDSVETAKAKIKEISE